MISNTHRSALKQQLLNQLLIRYIIICFGSIYTVIYTVYYLLINALSVVIGFTADISQPFYTFMIIWLYLTATEVVNCTLPRNDIQLQRNVAVSR